MTTVELIALRRTLGLKQVEMAQGIGLSLRAYSDVEGAEGDVKVRHALAIERFALDQAVERGNPFLAPPAVRARALDLVKLIRGA